MLAEAIDQRMNRQSGTLLDSYSATAVKRNWLMLQFSLWFTDLMSVYRLGNRMELKLKYTELEQLVTSESMARSFAERYLGRFQA